MDHRIASARPLGRALTASLAGVGLAAALFLAPTALAQQPAPAAKKPAAQKPAPAAKPAAPAAPAAGQPQAANEPPPLIYSSWVKLCQKGPESDNKQVCIIREDGRLPENGAPLILGELLQVEGKSERFRVTLPMSVIVQLQHGTHLVLDGADLGSAPYFACTPVGCLSDYEINAETVAKFKKGTTLVVQTYLLMNNTVISLKLPMTNFAKAYDGPATDPKVIEDQQRKLQSELQKKADEARKKLEQQQPAQAAPAEKK